MMLDPTKTEFLLRVSALQRYVADLESEAIDIEANFTEPERLQFVKNEAALVRARILELLREAA